MKKLLLTTALASLGFATSANATVWTLWSHSYTTGLTTGDAMGAMGGVTVSYDGEIRAGIKNPACGGICFVGPASQKYPSWTPASSWVDGTIVTSAPTEAGGTIEIAGGVGTGVDTITFSKPVHDPVIAIWSLGSGTSKHGIPAEFIFAETPTFVAGGKSTEYGGSSIKVSGNTVSGFEGNGSVVFLGTFSSISWTNPQKESWYGFTVGAVSTAIPEASTWSMLVLGFAGLGFAGYRKAKSAAVFAD
jgi:hypothetical protein